MSLSRFYVNPDVHQLEHNFWLREPHLYQEWTKVRHYRVGDEVVLFDGIANERLYRITHVEQDAFHLELVTEFERRLPVRHIYLFWAQLEPEQNERVIRQATELGISNFVPLLTTHSQEESMDMDHLKQVATEAAVHAGRSDLPHLRQPITLYELADDYAKTVQLLLCEDSPATPGAGKTKPAKPATKPKLTTGKSIGIVVGPDKGWTDRERDMLKKLQVGTLPLGHLNLRSETAAIVAAAKLLQ